MLCLAAGWVGVLALVSELRNMPTCTHGRKIVGNEHRSAMAFHGLHHRPFSLVAHLFSYSSIDVLPIDGLAFVAHCNICIGKRCIATRSLLACLMLQ